MRRLKRTKKKEKKGKVEKNNEKGIRKWGKGMKKNRI